VPEENALAYFDDDKQFYNSCTCKQEFTVFVVVPSKVINRWKDRKRQMINFSLSKRSLFSATGLSYKDLLFVICNLCSKLGRLSLETICRTLQHF